MKQKLHNIFPNMFSVGVLRQKYLKGISDLDADLLVQLCSGKNKVEILTHPECRLTVLQLVKFFYFRRRYRHGTPIAYLTGHKEFYGLDFKVNKHTLIPRPDTEILVEEALKILNLEKITAMIDVGTGSGCIPIAILKNTNSLPATFATDISEEAIHVARFNAKKHEVKIDFKTSNLIEKLKEIPAGNILITANLPYLSEEQFAEEPSIQKEPHLALVANENGLALYRELLEQLKVMKREFIALLEFDPRQTEEFKTMVKNILPTSSVQIKTDLAGRDRVLIIRSN